MLAFPLMRKRIRLRTKSGRTPDDVSVQDAHLNWTIALESQKSYPGALPQSPRCCRSSLDAVSYQDGLNQRLGRQSVDQMAKPSVNQNWREVASIAYIRSGD